MGETNETKLEDDFHESREQLSIVEEEQDCAVSETKETTAQHESTKLEEELQRLKKQLSEAEKGRDRAEIELRKTRAEAEEEKSRLNETIAEEKAELDSIKKSLAFTTQELKIKEDEIESLKVDATRVKTLELNLAEKDAELGKLNEEIKAAKNAEPWEKRIGELEEELERQKESEAKVLESLSSAKKQLEESKISLEESRVAACSLRDKYEDLLNGDHGEEKDETTPRNNKSSDIDVDEALETLIDELQLTKESLFRAQEGERAALSKAQSLLSEIGKLRNELKLATNAEINSTKAMDDLVIALSEVAAESNKVKLRLEVVEVELENSRWEVDELKSKGKSAEDMYMSLLEESRREAEQFKKKAERSTLEAEEMLLTWTEKENGFVKCIRRAEEEKSLVQEENIRLLESIKRVENMVRASKEKNNKLRDILKQALNEANVAKEAANIAKAENSQLKDSLADKEEALEFLTMEIHSLRANEAAAMKNVKELERLVSGPSSPNRDPGLEDKEGTLKNDKEGNLKKESPKILAKAFSFNLMELKIHTKHKESNSSDEKNRDHGEEREGDEEDPEDFDPLKGSIFDVMDSPGSARHRRKGSGFSGEGTPLTQEELAQLEDSHLHDLENGRFSSRRRRLLRKFGDLIIRRRPSYAEPSK